MVKLRQIWSHQIDIILGNSSLNIWPFPTIKICLLPNTELTLKKLPKWQNVAKSGHTGGRTSSEWRLKERENECKERGRERGKRV